jgi:hypothetical protein
VILELTSVLTAPAKDVTPAEMGLKYRSKNMKREPLIIEQTIVEQPITIVQNQNLGAINQLAQLAETELAALVKSQIALITEVETIKNNIRVNTIKSRFSQVVSQMRSPVGGKLVPY